MQLLKQVEVQLFVKVDVQLFLKADVQLWMILPPQTVVVAWVCTLGAEGGEDRAPA